MIPIGRDAGNSTISQSQYAEKDLKQVSKAEPCVICKATKWCARSISKGDKFVLCHHETVPPSGYRFVAHAKEDGILFSSEEPTTYKPLPNVYYEPSTNTNVAKTPQRPVPTKWAKLCRQFQDDLSGHSVQLAVSMGVTEESLKALGVGWNKEQKCWTFPERDSTGNIVGIMRRFKSPKMYDGEPKNKLFIGGGSRGIYYDPAMWRRGNGPILIVEGESDTAAAITMGLPVIGRPSVGGGCIQIAEMLKDISHDRPIVVVGEWDEKEKNGKILWPGKYAAQKFATNLANKLHREILWSLPWGDGEAKDTRSILQTKPQSGRITEARVGEAFVTSLIEDAEAFAGSPAPIKEKAIKTSGEARDLEEWRDEIEQSRMSAAFTTGIQLDRSPTGSGKTFATTELTKVYEKSLTVLPTHANVLERVQDMQGAGINASSYPELSETNCQNFIEASRARKAGLQVASTVCTGCPFRDSCDYQNAMKIAEKSPHKVGTHERLIRSPSAADNCELVVIDENPFGVLSPSLIASVRGIERVSELAHRIRTRSLQNEDKDGGAVFFDLMVQACDEMLSVCAESNEAGRYEIHMPTPPDIPSNYQRILWRALQRNDPRYDPRSEALQMVMRAVRHDFLRLELLVDNSKSGQQEKTFFCSWKTPTDTEKKLYQLLDATGNIDQLHSATGEDVVDCTPQGHLKRKHPITQFPEPITCGMKPNTVARILRGVLEKYPEKKRIGLIGHQGHIKHMMSESSRILDDETRKKIKKYCYYWQGPERASNDWHKECDVLIVLGTSRPPTSTVRQHLLLTGNEEAASNGSPVWGEIQWESQTTEGVACMSKGYGYHDPDWRAAHQAICRTQLLQSIGRARSLLEEGIPCILVADEPVGADIDTRPIYRLSQAIQKLVDVIRECLLSAISNPNNEKWTSTHSILAHPDMAGLARSSVMKQLKYAVDDGILRKVGRGRYELLNKTAEQIVLDIEYKAGLIKPLEEPKHTVSTSTEDTVHITASGTTEGQEYTENCKMEFPVEATKQGKSDPKSTNKQAAIWDEKSIRQLNPWRDTS